MGKDNVKRLVCSTLCAAMLSQPLTSTAGAWWGDWYAPPETYAVEEQAVPLAETPAVTLHDGTAVIPAGSSAEEVKQILAAALTDEPSLDLDWEYYCEGKNGLLRNSAWVSIGGGTSSTKKLGITTNYTHPALADNSDGEYRIRLAGTTDVDAVTLTKASALDSSITLADGASAAIPYDESGSVDFNALRESIFRAAVANTTPEMTAADVTIEYYATATSGSLSTMGKEWVQLEGGKVGLLNLNYPAISAGTHQIRFTYNGGSGYGSAQAETTVTLTERSEAPYVLNDPAGSVKLPLNEEMSVNYEALKGMIFNAVVAHSDVLTAENVTIEYYATAKTGTALGIGQKWMPLSGGKDAALEYPGIPAGTQRIRISWPGSQQYAPTTIEASVEVLDREALSVTLKDAPYEVGMVFNAEQGYDYEATARAVYDAVVASTSPEASYEAALVEYNTDRTGITHVSYKPLSEKDPTGLISFKDGKWEIRISWADTLEYRGTSVTVEVTATDNRVASAVVLKEGASFTYNMDPAVMERAIFEQVIDWENSTLPAGVDISAFEIAYKAQMDVLDSSVDADSLGGLVSKIPGMENIGGSIGDIAGSLGDTTKRFMPIAGGKHLGVPYAPMGAGEHQVQVTFKGSADYKPSEAAEASVTVNKASVKVKVRSDNIRAGEPLPANFITTDPADKFEFYTIYAGATSNVNLGIYLDLPDKYDNNKLIKLLDPVVEKIVGKSFSQMLQDGVTLGELRQLFNSTELLDLLEKVGVDTGAFGQIIKVVSALPSITDTVRVSFGTPNRAGLYAVTVITDNKNYNTGVGVGALLVRMHLKGVKLTWNQELGKKISAAEAGEFDFGATLSNDGDVTIDQGSVHYLYSGFTSKLRPYSSTKTPPTEPGRYVVTVVTLGGNYQAAPITRSYQITK